ncbi:unnamed protein product [Didymodactylos carnosus]|uniref:ADP ribosyltransferase domain-containing protein n=1 Tax=Didymodactylos carnosus TaxID=1234261 RepID=A0A814U6W9_9BILA|nr:unnamed protein product [Didymodactylos carnosus]CAF1171771.1 unnamed protein product [Didymodactylos carnosus]CAF3935704.1 unnamed protein product [Didymodactylos carnosus]CAF3980680.1 unnamed protein product [Didymodactylos carnosus]
MGNSHASSHANHENDENTFAALKSRRKSAPIVPPLNLRAVAANETTSGNQEDITLLWVGAVPKSYNKQKLEEKLQQVNNSVKIYDDLTIPVSPVHLTPTISCMKDSLEYIQLIEKEKAVIILSHSNAMTIDSVKEYLGEVNQKRQIVSILILDIFDHSNDSLYPSFTKALRFDNFDKLFAAAVSQIESIVREALAFSLFDQKKQRTTKDLTKEAASFLWFQVLVDALKKMPTSKNSLTAMVNMCRSYYNTQPKYAADITEFAGNYMPADAVKWYTRETFLYRLVNKALRTEDVTSLYLFRTFIVDLCNQLEAEFDKMKQEEDELVLYRGQQMSENEIDKLQHNEHSLISTNGFFSTTRSKKVAVNFAKTHSTPGDVTPVLFEIRVSTKLEKVVFADITKLSEFSMEAEVLFSIGAVFQIDKVEYDHPDKMYKVYMLATDEGSKNVAILGNRSSDSGKRMLFGELLLDMGKYAESQKYFETMKEQMQADDAESSDIYHNLGRAYGYKGEYDKALENFNRAYEIRQRSLSSYDFSLANTLNSLGVIYGEKGEYDKAKKKFNDALEMQERCQSGDEKTKTLHIAQSRSNIGWIHFLKGEYPQALDCHKKALADRKKFLGEDALLLADNYSSIGGVHHALGEFDKAMETYIQALNIREANLPSEHPSIALNYQVIGGVLHEYGRYEDALEKYKRALDIRAKALGANHSSVASVYKSIGGVYLDQGAYEEALKQYMRALEICMSTVSENHPTTGDCYHSLGMLCERQNHFAEALQHYNKARKITTKYLPIDHPSVAKVWTSIANVKLREGAYDKSIEMYEKVLEIQNVGGEEHPDIILTYNNFGVLYRLKKDYQKAQEYFQKAFAMCGKYFVEDHPLKARIIHNMGDMYTDMEDFEKAVDQYKQAVKMREATLPPNDLSTASSYYNLGCAYFEKNNRVKAMSCFEKTIGIYENQRTRDEKAIKRVQKAIDITEESYNIAKEKDSEA